MLYPEVHARIQNLKINNSRESVIRIHEVQKFPCKLLWRIWIFRNCTFRCPLQRNPKRMILENQSYYLGSILFLFQYEKYRRWITWRKFKIFRYFMPSSIVKMSGLISIFRYIVVNAAFFPFIIHVRLNGVEILSIFVEGFEKCIFILSGP